MTIGIIIITLFLLLALAGVTIEIIDRIRRPWRVQLEEVHKRMGNLSSEFDKKYCNSIDTLYKEVGNILTILENLDTKKTEEDKLIEQTLKPIDWNK